MVLRNLRPFTRAAIAFAVALLLLSTAGAGRAQAQQSVQLSYIAGYPHGSFNTGAAEISSFDHRSRRLFVINAQATSLDILDVSNPASPSLVRSVDLSGYGAGIQSVDVYNGLVAVAVESDPKTDPGFVLFLDVNGTVLSQVTVGALPDMVTFTPNGQYLLVANEGEPSTDYSIDPEGSISVIAVRGGGNAGITQSDVRTADFHDFNVGNIDSRIRIFGPGASVQQDLEPEYIAVSNDSRTAYVTLQENNAIAVIDIRAAQVARLMPLGTKDHSLAGNALDASDRDGAANGPAINIANWPVRGMYLPDGIAAYDYRSHTYLVTANEGDTRDYTGFVEEIRVGSGSYTLDPTRFPNAATLKQNANLGRLTVTRFSGNLDGDSDYDEIHVFGARSFSIWTDYGALVYDSGDDFERITALAEPLDFNSSNDANGSFDTRSDNKGPEPEGVAIGKIQGRTYAFIGLERMGGIMVYDITTPTNPGFVQYINTRLFGGNPAAGTAGDLGPEGLHFVEKGKSPNGHNLLFVANEISGTTAVFQVDPVSLNKVVPENSGAGSVVGIVAPNPASSHVRVPITVAGEHRVRVLVSTMDGRDLIVSDIDNTDDRTSAVILDVSSLESGNYFIRVLVGSSVAEIRPLVITR